MTTTNCKCTFAQRTVGDGCDVCNPAKALDYAYETIDDLRAHNTLLIRELTRFRLAVHDTWAASPEGRAELARIADTIGGSK